MKYDCVVVGAGGDRSAALFAATRRGWSVLGIDRFAATHDRGSSHGRTRIIRTAYFDSVNVYSMSRDGHFIVDRHPESRQISFAAGLSGHEYKLRRCRVNDWLDCSKTIRIRCSIS